MSELHIVNIQRTLLARAIWEASGQVTLELLVPEYEDALTTIINNAGKSGIPLHVSRKMNNDKLIYMEEKITVLPNDKRFLQALANYINMHMINEQRIFGVLTASQEV